MEKPAINARAKEELKKIDTMLISSSTKQFGFLPNLFPYHPSSVRFEYVANIRVCAVAKEPPIAKLSIFGFLGVYVQCYTTELNNSRV